MDGHRAQHTVTRIHHEARRPSRNVQRQDSLSRHVRGGRVENLKQDLRNALSVSLGVQKGALGQDGMFLPDFLRAAVIRDDTAPNGILQRQHTALTQRSRQMRRKGDKYLYPALGRRPRNLYGGRGRPWRSPARVRPEAEIPSNACSFICLACWLPGMVL